MLIYDLLRNKWGQLQIHFHYQITNLKKGSGSYIFPSSYQAQKLFRWICFLRLNKRLASRLIRILRPFLTGRTQNALSKRVKVLSCLQVFASGSYQQVVADSVWTFTSQASVSRSVDEVLRALLEIRTRYIGFPNTTESRRKTSERYFDFFFILKTVI